MYRLFYWTYDELHLTTVNDTIENIVKKFSVYYLTDMCGNAIIDNRKRGNPNG